MMRSTNISTDLAFYALLVYLFLINVSIAGCYILLTLILLIFLLDLARNRTFPVLPFFYYFLILYAFFTLMATVFSIDRAASIRDNKELLILLLIPIYIWLLTNWKRLWISLWVVLASAVFSSLAGIFTVLNKGFSNGIVLSDRLQGFTSHWMTYAGLLMFVFIFFFVLLLLSNLKQINLIKKQDNLLSTQPSWIRALDSKFKICFNTLTNYRICYNALKLLILRSRVRQKRDKQAIVISGSLVIMSVAIAFSLTRSAWLGIAVSLILFLIFFKPKYFLVLAPLVLILALLAPSAVKSRVLSIVDLQDRSNRDRIHMVYSGLKIFHDYPWTGVGSNNIEKVIALNKTRYLHPQAEKINPHLHNNFLQILAERGIFALASFFLACLFIILQLLKLLKSRTGDWHAITAGVLFTFCGFLIAGMFEYNFGDSEIKFILFYFLSLPFLNLKGDDHVQIEKNY